MISNMNDNKTAMASRRRHHPSSIRCTRCTRRTRSSSGFSITELMIVMFIITLLAALGAPAFSRYIKKARTAEVSNSLAKVWSGAIAYYSADHTDSAGSVMAHQFPVGTDACDMTPDLEPRCCTSGTGKCPGSHPIYNKEPFISLQFNLPDAHMYRVGFDVVGSACDATRFLRAKAFGDLDCDNIESQFIRMGRVSTTGDVEGGYPAEVNPIE